MRRSTRARQGVSKTFSWRKDDFCVKTVDEDVGRGVFANKEFGKGDFLLPYEGCVHVNEEPVVADDTFIFEYSYGGKPYWIDASAEDGSLGRLINDEFSRPNCVAKTFLDQQGTARIGFFALRKIAKGEELRYSYGGQRSSYAWRSQTYKKCYGLARKQRNRAVEEREKIGDVPVPVQMVEVKSAALPSCCPGHVSAGGEVRMGGNGLSSPPTSDNKSQHSLPSQVSSPGDSASHPVKPLYSIAKLSNDGPSSSGISYPLLSAPSFSKSSAVPENPGNNAYSQRDMSVSECPTLQSSTSSNSSVTPHPMETPLQRCVPTTPPTLVTSAATTVVSNSNLPPKPSSNSGAPAPSTTCCWQGHSSAPSVLSISSSPRSSPDTRPAPVSPPSSMSTSTNGRGRLLSSNENSLFGNGSAKVPTSSSNSASITKPETSVKSALNALQLGAGQNQQGPQYASKNIIANKCTWKRRSGVMEQCRTDTSKQAKSLEPSPTLNDSKVTKSSKATDTGLSEKRSVNKTQVPGDDVNISHHVSTGHPQRQEAVKPHPHSGLHSNSTLCQYTVSEKPSSEALSPKHLPRRLSDSSGNKPAAELSTSQPQLTTNTHSQDEEDRDAGPTCSLENLTFCGLHKISQDVHQAVVSDSESEDLEDVGQRDDTTHLPVSQDVHQAVVSDSESEDLEDIVQRSPDTTSGWHHGGDSETEGPSESNDIHPDIKISQDVHQAVVSDSESEDLEDVGQRDDTTHLPGSQDVHPSVVSDSESEDLEDIVQRSPDTTSGSHHGGSEGTEGPSESTDIIHPDIKITSIIKSRFISRSGEQREKKNYRVFNKPSACFYCERLFTNISHHYESKHRDERRVAEILALKEQGKEKDKEVKKQWDLLRNEGNHNHNKVVLSSKNGELLVVRRNTGENFCSTDYSPCPLCLGWYMKSGLYIHMNYRCVARGQENVRSSSILVRSLTQREIESPEKMDTEVFLTMRNDDLTNIAKSDFIIRRIGEFYFTKHSQNKLRCKNFASKHMRALASLLKESRQIDGSHKDLDFYLRPQKFDVVQKAAVTLAGGQDGNFSNLEHPSTLKNIGYDLKQAAEIKEEEAIKQHNLEKVSETKFFLKLYRRRWKLLSASAMKQLEEKTYNKSINLPTCSELQTVVEYMKEKLNDVVTKGTVASTEYRDVVELVQARLLLFNKRRPGELEALRLEDFEKRRNNDTVLSDAVTKTLTKLERKLMESHQIVTVRGKRGHAVPILIPPDCTDAMVMIADPNIRKRAGVKSTNPYMFANSGDEVYRGVQSLKQVLEKCDANIDMTHIKAGTLRKYLATNCQLLNLSSTELDWVVRHLGHSKLTHLSNYRLTSSTVEKTKIAKLLVLLENGMLSEAQGSSLNDQQLDELILKKLQPKGINEKDSQEEVPDFIEVEQELENSETGFVQDSTCDTTEGDHGIASHSDSDYIPDSDAHESSSEDCTDEPPPKIRKVDVHVQRRNKKWPPEAEDVLKREFSTFLHGKTYPSFREIRRLRNKHHIFFGDRTEAQIKSKLAHLKNCLSSV